MKELNLEKEKLEKTLEIIRTVLEEEQEDLKNLYKEFVGTKEELWEIADRKKIRISNLEIATEKPYFARIDFVSDEDNSKSTIYIGKNGVIQNNNIIVTDWRAPISSLYYDSEVGRCSYEAPSGMIEGEMQLKRQYEIENGELLEYYDVNLVANDGLLQKYLNSNNDSRLKSIVSTIQKEQNDVIRKKLVENLIIQGVAGSGKTTVALHRIAYLVYNYMNNISQKQYLVIGPNPVFIKYINSVLPELDVSGVSQYTFEQFAKIYIEEDLNINSSDKKVNENIAGKKSNDVDKFKCSIKYKNMIDYFMEAYISNLTSRDLKIGDFVILDKEKIEEIFESTRSNYSSGLNTRIELTIERIVKYIEEHNDSIILKYSNYSYELFNNAQDDKERELIRKKIAKEREEIKKNCKTIIRKYFTKTKNTPTRLYKLFVSTLEIYDCHEYLHSKELKKKTLANIKNESYDFEDLAALMYLKKLISPNKEYEKIKHVVIDEAQDLGEFNFFIMKNILSSATFSIFGDLAQSIYDYRGINNWDEVNKVMFENRGQIINFNKSYRTTAEIMTVADTISTSIGLGNSELVVRHGNPVEFTHIKNNDEIPMYISKKIKEYIESGYKTIAIISKTNLLSCYINDDLAEIGLNIPNITINDDVNEEEYRICTISNQLAKGLEFDAVIINNAAEEIYSSENALDMKLLYVAITRALHELDIVYSGELTKPLQGIQNKVKRLQSR